MSRRCIGVIQGPNLHWLGKREPEIYGSATLADIESELTTLGESFGVSVEHFQSNHEGEIVDHIYALHERGVRELILNAGALTHTSVAIRDALAGTGARFVEVHISNVYKREAFRHHSYLSDIASGIIVGCGPAGYALALRWLVGL